MKDGGQNRKSDYLAINPMGQLPTLQDGTFHLTQSVAIISYLDRLYPQVSLFANEPKLFARQLALCEILNSGIQPLQNIKVLNYLRANYKQNDDQIADWCRFWIEEGFGPLEQEIAKLAGRYSVGDTPSAVDCFVVPQVFNGFRYKADMKRFPSLLKIWHNCNDLEAFKKAHPDHQPDAE